jgi:superfamily II RNA helicase
MPIKNPFRKRNFADKREAAGITRNKTGSMTGTIDPKLKKIGSSISKEEVLLHEKLVKLSSFKPKNQIEANNKKKAISLTNKKLSDLINSRGISRTKRQEEILEKKLIQLLSEAGRQKLKNFSEDPFQTIPVFNRKKLREEYLSLLKKRNITVNEITSKDALKLLESAAIPLGHL